MKLAFILSRLLAVTCTALIFIGTAANAQGGVKSAPPPDGATFVASAGIYWTQKEAQAAVKELKRMGDVNAQVIKVQGMGEAFYRVQLPAKNLDDAREQGTKIDHVRQGYASIIYSSPENPDVGAAVITGTVQSFDGKKVDVKVERVTNEVNGAYLRTMTFEMRTKGAVAMQAGQRVRLLVSDLRVYALEADGASSTAAAAAVAEGANDRRSFDAQPDSRTGQQGGSQTASGPKEGAVRPSQWNAGASGPASATANAKTVDQVPQCIKWGIEEQSIGYQLQKGRVAVIKNVCSFKISAIGCVTALTPGRRSASCSNPEPTVGFLHEADGRRSYQPTSLAPGQAISFIPMDGKGFGPGDQINDGSFVACPAQSEGKDIELTQIRRLNTLYTGACSVRVPPPIRKSCVAYKVVPQTPECASTLWTNTCQQDVTAKVCRKGGSQGNTKCETLEFQAGSQTWSTIGGVCNSADTRFYVEE